MVDYGVLRDRRLVHPLLAVLVPFVFLQTFFVVLIGGALASFGVQLFPAYFSVPLALAGITESVSGNVLQQKRIGGFAPRFRELLLLLIACFGLILLLFGDLTGAGINLRRLNIWLSLAVVAFQWFLSYYVHGKLREREQFLRYFSESPEVPPRDSYITHNEEGVRALAAIAAVKRLVVVFVSLVMLGLTIFVWPLGLSLDIPSLILVCVAGGGGVLALGVANRFVETQRALAWGHAIGADQTKAKHRHRLLLLVTAAVVALPLSGARPPIPEQTVGAFLQWIAAIGQGEPRPFVTGEAELPDEGGMVPGAGFVSTARTLFGERESGEGIGRYVGPALLALLGLALLFFLVRPLFDRRKGATPPWRRLRNRVMAFFAALRGLPALLRRRFRAFSENRRQQGRRLGRILTQARDVVFRAGSRRQSPTKAEVSPAQRRTRNKVLKSFFRFTEWGRKQGVSFSLSTAPREFCELVAGRFPDRRDEILTVATLFDEIVYSHHDKPDELLDRFHRHTGLVVRSRSPR